MILYRLDICIVASGKHYPYLLVKQSWGIKLTHRLVTGCKPLKVAAYSHFDCWAKINAFRNGAWENDGSEIKVSGYDRSRHQAIFFPAKWFSFDDKRFQFWETRASQELISTSESAVVQLMVVQNFYCDVSVDASIGAVCVCVCVCVHCNVALALSVYALFLCYY